MMALYDLILIYCGWFRLRCTMDSLDREQTHCNLNRLRGVESNILWKLEAKKCEYQKTKCHMGEYV